VILTQNYLEVVYTRIPVYIHARVVYTGVCNYNYQVWRKWTVARGVDIDMCIMMGINVPFNQIASSLITMPRIVDRIWKMPLIRENIHKVECAAVLSSLHNDVMIHIDCVGWDGKKIQYVVYNKREKNKHIRMFTSDNLQH
jgi:Na+-transporting NADH:ubiquinone oxidoreductase subunit NqrE